MRMFPTEGLEALRRRHPTLPQTSRGDTHGYFVLGKLRIISSGIGMPGEWEHVSVSCADRCPTWDEMAMVKGLFWDEEETVVQFHPPRSQYVNAHPYCLHLWRHVGHDPELPPRWTLTAGKVKA